MLLFVQFSSLAVSPLVILVHSKFKFHMLFHLKGLDTLFPKEIKTLEFNLFIKKIGKWKILGMGGWVKTFFDE